MKEVLELLKFGAAQGTSTIGSVTRAWLWVVGSIWLPLSLWTNAYGFAPFRDHMAASFIVSLYAAVWASIPVMAVLMLIHIARKW